MKNISSENSPSWRPLRVLSIAGSDSGGGAGLQADLKTVSSLGGYSATAVTAVTVQNTVGVKNVWNVPTELVCQQIDAVCEDIRPDAIKISMLPLPDMAEAIARTLEKYPCGRIVVDPVIVSTSGHRLVPEDGVDNLVRHLFPLASVITPNLEEVAVLTGILPSGPEDYVRAANRLLETGPRAVLVKGGHAPEGGEMKDLLLCRERPDSPVWITSPRLKSRNLHGTGCTLSAAIAFFLAQSDDIVLAVSKAKEYIFEAIRTGADMEIGSGFGPVNHFFSPLPCRPQPL